MWTPRLTCSVRIKTHFSQNQSKTTKEKRNKQKYFGITLPL